MGCLSDLSREIIECSTIPINYRVYGHKDSPVMVNSSNAKRGLRVMHQASRLQGTIYLVGPIHYKNITADEGQCIVQWDDSKYIEFSYSICNIGNWDYNQDLILINKKEDGKTIKVQRVNTTVRKGIRRRSYPIQSGASRAKCARGNF
jgi:hypothetical protein